MATSTAAQSHSFADCLYTVEWSYKFIYWTMILQHRTCYMSAKGFGSSKQIPKCQVLWMTRRCRSWNITEHEQTISRKLKKNSLKKSSRFPRSFKVLSFLVFWFRMFRLPLRLMHLSPDRITFGKANLLCFALWSSWKVSLSQERDECSEEIARMHALEETYKAEIAHLAKESQVASSFRMKTLTWL